MQVFLTYDLATGETSSSIFDELALPVDLHIGFAHDGTLPVSLAEIEFSLNGASSRQDAIAVSWPPSGVSYEMTDQPVVESVRWELKHGDSAELDLVVSSAQRVVGSATFIFFVPIPESPYASWVWDEIEARWKAPVPRPEGSVLHVWSEESQVWATPDPIIEQGDPNGTP